ncbi:unnamed protein product [Chrysoparadoxa australica]
MIVRWRVSITICMLSLGLGLGINPESANYDVLLYAKEEDIPLEVGQLVAEAAERGYSSHPMSLEGDGEFMCYIPRDPSVLMAEKTPPKSQKVEMLSDLCFTMPPAQVPGAVADLPGWEICPFHSVRRLPGSGHAKTVTYGGYDPKKDTVTSEQKLKMFASKQVAGDEQLYTQHFTYNAPGDPSPLGATVYFQCSDATARAFPGRPVARFGVTTPRYTPHRSDGIVEVVTDGSGQVHALFQTPLLCSKEEAIKAVFESELGNLRHACIKYRAQGWWTYELCLGRHVWQYHLAETGEVSDKYVIGEYDTALNAEMAAKGTSFVQREAGAGSGGAADAMQFIEVHNNGTKCEVPGSASGIQAKARTAEVVFSCGRQDGSAGPAGLQPYVMSIVEGQTCSYTMQVALPGVCRVEEAHRLKTASLPIPCVPRTEPAQLTATT